MLHSDKNLEEKPITGVEYELLGMGRLKFSKDSKVSLLRGGGFVNEEALGMVRILYG